MTRRSVIRSVTRMCAVLVLASLPAISGAQQQAEIGAFLIETDSTLGLPRVSLLEDDRTLPLWSPTSLDSSSAFVRIGNTVELLSNESPSVRAEVIEDHSSFTVRWSVRDIDIDLSVVVRENDAEDTFVLRMRISNRGDRIRSVGVRYLIDTWLGEHAEAHFETGRGRRVTAERNFTSGDEAVVSTGPDGVFRLQLDRGTGPSSVSVANRQRLTDAGWAYSPGRERGFSLPPFSVHDSALHILYDREDLQPGGTRTIETWFSAATDDLRVARGAREPDEPVDEPDRPSVRDPGAVPSVPPSPGVPVDPVDPDITDSDVADPSEIARELRDALERLREISDGQRRAEPGELEELRETIERLRRERDRL